MKLSFSMFPVLVAGGMVGLGPVITPVSAQSGVEVWRFFQPGASARDNGFGPLVTANSQIAATGNPTANAFVAGNDHLGRGEVNLFNLTTGRQIRTLTPPPGDAVLAGLGFGSALSFSGNVLAVGASGISGNLPGRVYLFRANGQLLGQFAGPEVGFGFSVCLHGNRLLVGSPLEESGRGAAYLFDADNPEAAPKRLVAPTRAENDRFGREVVVSPDFAVVSAPFETTSRGIRAGAGYVFNAVAPFNLLDRITDENVSLPHPMGAFAELGTAVAVAGRVVYLSAPGTALGGSLNGGSVLIFDTATRSVAHQLLGPFGDSARFGAVMDCADNLLVVGHGVSASSAPPPSAVYSVNDFTVPILQGTLLPSGLEEGDKLDGGVAVSGHTVVLAVQGDSGGINDGAVFRVSQVRRPDLPGQLALRRGDSATGVPAAEFSNIDQHLNDFNDFWVLGSLRRPASRNHGVWGNDGVPFFLRGIALPDALVAENAVLSRLRSIQAVGGRVQIEVTRSGPGITSANNTGFYVREGGSVGRGFMKGDVVASQTASFPSLERFVSAGLSVDGNTVIRASLKRDRATGVNAANDSVVAFEKAVSVVAPFQTPLQEADTVAGRDPAASGHVTQCASNRRGGAGCSAAKSGGPASGSNHQLGDAAGAEGRVRQPDWRQRRRSFSRLPR